MKPWFRYLAVGAVPFFWWPCHWKGVALMLGCVMVMIGSMLLVIALAPPPNSGGLPLLAAVIAMLPFWLVGMRHSEMD